MADVDREENGILLGFEVLFGLASDMIDAHETHHLVEFLFLVLILGLEMLVRHRG